MDSARGWLQSVSASLGATTVYSLGMTYTGDGDVLTGNDSVNGNWTYGYDDFNRLAASTKGSPATQAFTYSYDRFGNRWSQTATVGGGPSPNFSFDANNHISDGSSTCDAAGNTRTYNDGVATHTYTYDAENRMIAADTSTYVYDAEGRRVKKVVSGAGSEFLYDLGGHVMTEFNSTGLWVRGELYADGRQLATYRNGTTYFAHADWLGTQRLRTDVSGAPVAGESYQSPFGDAMTPATVGVSPNHFTGKERDAESGLDYFGARYYGSLLGRFLCADDPFADQDSEDPQSWNLYSYVRNNPLANLDSDGRECHQKDNGDMVCNVNGNTPPPPPQKTPQQRIREDAINPGFLGPFDIFFIRLPRFGILSRVLGKTAGEAAAKAAVEAA